MVHRHTVHVVIKATLCLLVIVMNLILEAINYYYYYYYMFLFLDSAAYGH